MPRPPYRLLVFVTGFSGLALEMLSTRMLAPFYGTSNLVWAVVISGVLAAVSAGAALGGKLADGRTPSPVLAALLLLGASSGIAADSLIYLLVKHLFYRLSLGLASQALLFVLIVVSLSLPALVLSAILPVATRELSSGSDKPGGRIGSLYAVNTLGSVAGSLTSVLVLVPLLGILKSMAVTAVLLTASGIPAILSAGKAFSGARKRAAIVLLVFTGLCFCLSFLLAPKILPAGLAEYRESGYQTIQVFTNAGAVAVTVNDPRFVQSIKYDDGQFRLNTWSAYLAAPFFLGERPHLSILFVGYGGGSAAALYDRYFPESELSGIELDPAMIETGRKWIYDPRRVRITTGDGRSELYAMRKKYDVIVSDVYRFPYVPHHLLTEEFFALVKSKLREGGVMVFNAGDVSPDRSFLSCVEATILKVFGHVYAYPSSEYNTLLFATDGAVDPAAFRSGNPDLERLLEDVKKRCSEARPERSAPVFTDEVYYSEFLTHRMGVRYVLR